VEGRTPGIGVFGSRKVETENKCSAYSGWLLAKSAIGDVWLMPYVLHTAAAPARTGPDTAKKCSEPPDGTNDSRYWRSTGLKFSRFLAESSSTPCRTCDHCGIMGMPSKATSCVNRTTGRHLAREQPATARCRSRRQASADGNAWPPGIRMGPVYTPDSESRAEQQDSAAVLPRTRVEAYTPCPLL
jgi:hypothetical protein